HLLALLDDEGLLAGDRGIGGHHDGDSESLFESTQMSALVVEEIERDLRTGPHREIVGCPFEQHLLDRAEKLQGNRRDGAYMAGAAAMRTFLRRAFKHARADALA